MGEYPYFDENLRSEYVGPGVTSLVLTNLASFAVYEILATAVTVKGDGPPAIIHAGMLGQGGQSYFILKLPL